MLDGWDARADRRHDTDAVDLLLRSRKVPNQVLALPPPAGAVVCLPACLPVCLSIRFPTREATTARLAARRAGRRAFVHTYRLGGPVGVVVVAWSSGLHAGLHAHVAVFCSIPDKVGPIYGRRDWRHHIPHPTSTTHTHTSKRRTHARTQASDGWAQRVCLSVCLTG